MRSSDPLRLLALALALGVGGCGGEAMDDDGAVCGDSVLSPSEACEDGNLEAGDGCDPSCVVEPGYVCDAQGICRTPCGDGVVVGMEACDDGNQLSGDGCSATCEIEPIIGGFRPVTGADPMAVVTSNEVEINIGEGSLVTASTPARFDERIVVDGEERGVTARVTKGSRVALRMSAPPGFTDNRATALLVEGLRLEWRISTRTSTFAWRTGEFGDCSADCGQGVRVRDVECVDELGRVVEGALCAEPAPPSAERCTDESGCRYAYGAWTPWSACVNDTRTRSRPCIRQDGVEVECSFCGGDCAGVSACDVVCSRLGGSVINCSPMPPGDQMACDASITRAIERCESAGCALTTDSSTTCSVGGFPGIPQCYGGQAICE